VRPDDHCAASPTVSGHGPTNGARPCTARSSGQRCTSSPKHCGVAQLRNAAPLHSSPPPSTPGSAILPRRQACARTTTAPRRPRSVGTDQRTERTPARDGPRGGRGHPSPEHCGVAQLRSAAPLGGSHPPTTAPRRPRSVGTDQPTERAPARQGPRGSGARPPLSIAGLPNFAILSRRTAARLPVHPAQPSCRGGKHAPPRPLRRVAPGHWALASQSRTPVRAALLAALVDVLP